MPAARTTSYNAVSHDAHIAMNSLVPIMHAYYTTIPQQMKYNDDNFITISRVRIAEQDCLIVGGAGHNFEVDSPASVNTKSAMT